MADRTWSRIAIAGVIVGGHCLALRPLLVLAFREAPRPPIEFVISTAEVIFQAERRDKVPAPELQLTQAVIEESQLRSIQFDDSMEDELAGVMAPASAPRLMRFQSVNISVFARRAHLTPGRPAIVVLRIEVLADGGVGSVDVARSSGNPAADAAAVDYALELRWIPGTTEQRPRPMRINLPVTLINPV